MTEPSSPGLLLPFTVTCECRWRGVELDRAGALELWAAHVRRAGHSPDTSYDLHED
jgi:hypothetical protein